MSEQDVAYTSYATTDRTSHASEFAICVLGIA